MNYQNLMLLTSPERIGFNMYAEYTRQQLTFLALQPWKHPARKDTLEILILPIVFRPDGVDLELNNISQPDNSSPTGINICIENYVSLNWLILKIIHFFGFIKNTHY